MLRVSTETEIFDLNQAEKELEPLAYFLTAWHSHRAIGSAGLILSVWVWNFIWDFRSHKKTETALFNGEVSEFPQKSFVKWTNHHDQLNYIMFRNSQEVLGIWDSFWKVYAFRSLNLTQFPWRWEQSSWIYHRSDEDYTKPEASWSM